MNYSLQFRNARGKEFEVQPHMFVRCHMVSRLFGYSRPPEQFLKWAARTFPAPSEVPEFDGSWWRPYTMVAGEAHLSSWVSSTFGVLRAMSSNNQRPRDIPIESWFVGLADSLAGAPDEIHIEARSAEYANNPDYDGGGWHTGEHPQAARIDSYHKAVRAAISRGLIPGEVSTTELNAARNRATAAKNG